MVVVRAVIIAAVVVLGSTTVRANPKEAERAYKLGYKALSAGDFATALGHYQRSYALAPRPRTLFNMAACQEELSQPLEAWRNYQAFIAKAEPRDASFVVRARQRLEVLRKRLTGWVAVESTPAGAAVRVDRERQPRGLTPLTLALEPGRHVVRVSLAGATAAERSIDVEPETNSSISVELDVQASISIAVKPADALIKRAGQAAVVRGSYEAQVLPGSYEFTIERPGYRSEHLVIEATAGRNYEHHVSLQSQITTAALVVRGATDTTVIVDGTPADPSSLRTLVPGQHAIRVERPGHQAWTETLHLSPGETATVDVDWARPRSTADSVLTWGGLAVSVVGISAGSVLGVMALRDVTSPSTDDHDRGKTRALIADGLFTVGIVAAITAWRYARRSGTSRASVRRTHGEP